LRPRRRLTTRPFPETLTTTPIFGCVDEGGGGCGGAGFSPGSSLGGLTNEMFAVFSASRTSVHALPW
jgi:hypothetical protein